LHAAINTPAHAARIRIYRQQGDECEYAKGTAQAGPPKRIQNPLCLPKPTSRIKLVYCAATISHRFCGIHHRLGVCSKIETHR
jgi:hypothetical protein